MLRCESRTRRKRCQFCQSDRCRRPVEIAAAYDKAGADELVFLDITASSDARNIMIDMVRKVAEKVFIPFTVGGGIRTVEDFKAILREGADKISINSSAINTPDLINDAADKFGSQCVVVAIDAKRRADGIGWNVYKNGGRIDVGLDAVEWAMEANRRGAGEILLTSMDCDGTKAGYDNELTRIIAENVDIPVIASGGAGNKEHFYDTLTEGKADAALAASLFHFNELKISDLKDIWIREGSVSEDRIISFDDKERRLFFVRMSSFLIQCYCKILTEISECVLIT